MSESYTVVDGETRAMNYLKKISEKGNGLADDRV